MEPRRRVTLKDVAQRAGVSRTTASFVMAGRLDMRISAEAARRVTEAAAALCYHPNLTARSLRTSVTRTVGFVSASIVTDQFAGQFVRGALRGATDHGRLLVIGETEGDPASEHRVIREMLGRQVDGIVYATMDTREIMLPPLLRGHPLVLLNCFTADSSECSILPDEFAAGAAAARVVLEAGHNNDIYLVGETPSHLYAARQRLAGVEATLASAGRALAGTLACSWWPARARAAVQVHLTRRTLLERRPMAFICMTDRVALGTYQALTEAGLRVPAEASVVSFDGSELASWLYPPLTTVALPHFEMGRLALELLTASTGPVAGQHLMPMPVRSRASVGAPLHTLAAG